MVRRWDLARKPSRTSAPVRKGREEWQLTSGPEPGWRLTYSSSNPLFLATVASLSVRSSCWANILSRHHHGTAFSLEGVERSRLCTLHACTCRTLGRAPHQPLSHTSCTVLVETASDGIQHLRVLHRA